jgi:hypothetical protein
MLTELPEVCRFLSGRMFSSAAVLPQSINPLQNFSFVFADIIRGAVKRTVVCQQAELANRQF